MSKTEQFYNILFDQEDWTCFADDVRGVKTSPVHQIGKKEKHQFFVVNPIKAKMTRADVNVAKYRNFLFEIDEDKEGNPIDQTIQGTIIHKAGLPFSTCVYSGGKSLHWIVSLEDSFIEDRLEYVALWSAIAYVLNNTAKTLGYDFEFDDKVKNPSRFSRAAGAVRIKEDANNQIQEIKSVRSRVSSSDLIQWLESNDIDWHSFMPKPKTYDGTNDYNFSTSDEDKIAYVLKYLMKNQEYVQGNKNNWQFIFARMLKNTGMTEDAVRAAINTQCPEGEDYRNPIKQAFSSKYDTDEKIYVWSREEKRQWAQEQEHIANEVLVAKIDEDQYNGEIANLNASALHAYIRVANKYYRSDNVSIDLWDKTTIKDDFGSRALQDPALRKFRGFTNEPNYIKRVEYVTRNINGEVHSFYNRFKYPNWQLSKGEFPTILKLLNKVFVGEAEDQLEIGLDWLQLLFTKPKQNTKCLVLVGTHGGGKDTFMEWLVQIVTDANGIIIGGEELETNFNSSWAGKHLVCLNEVSYDLSDRKTKEKIKNLVTGEKIGIEGKGDNVIQINNYSKIVMATNNMFDFMKIDDTEDRFWTRELPPLRDGDRDSQFKEKLQDETPHFLYWLINERKLYRTEKYARFWHSPEETHTEAGRRVVENTKTSTYTELHELFCNRFNHPKLRDKSSMWVRPSTLITELYERPKQKSIKMCLLKEFGSRDHKTIRSDAFDKFNESNNIFFEITREQLGI